MRIKFTVEHYNGATLFKPGAVVEVTPSSGKALIEQGKAIEVDPNSIPVYDGNFLTNGCADYSALKLNTETKTKK